MGISKLTSTGSKKLFGFSSKPTHTHLTTSTQFHSLNDSKHTSLAYAAHSDYISNDDPCHVINRGSIPCPNPLGYSDIFLVPALIYS